MAAVGLASSHNSSQPWGVWEWGLPEKIVTILLQLCNNKTIKLLFTHILDLNTVTLQISKETLFEAGESNHIKK